MSSKTDTYLKLNELVDDFDRNYQDLVDNAPTTDHALEFERITKQMVQCINTLIAPEPAEEEPGAAQAVEGADFGKGSDTQS